MDGREHHVVVLGVQCMHVLTSSILQKPYHIEFCVYILKAALRKHQLLTYVYLSTDNNDAEELAAVRSALGANLLPSFRFVVTALLNLN